MRIRRFEAPDQKSALAMVKGELGEDAVILANRTIRSASGRSSVEVVAAMDQDVFRLAGEEPVTRNAAEAGSVSSSRPEPPPERFAGSLRAQLHARGVSDDQHPPHLSPPVAAVRPPRPAVAPAGRESGDVARWREEILARIRYEPFRIDSRRRRVIALVGATGVGKTTTAAKLAAWASLRQGGSVALVSMDCYRIGATDQLRTYARIMNLQCDVAMQPRDLARSLARFSGKDMVIVDTTGKNPYDESHVQELLQWFGPETAVEPYLTLSATTKKEDIAAVLNAYEPLGIRGLVLTKLDETRAYAALCQQLAAAGVPVAGLGCGQKVPEDFLLASEETAGTLFRNGWPAFVSWLEKIGRDAAWQ
ncbi:MAG: AAA family ATPase [Thermodesulfobacteriota bacterium]